MQLETLIGIVFAALCLLVLTAAAIVLVGAVLTARGLAVRAKAMRPYELLEKVRRASDDLERLARSLQALLPLVRRAAVALGAIARNVATARALAGRIVFGWFPTPTGSRESRP